MKPFFEKFGTGGALVAALACPICFPKLALVGAAVGLGAFAPYEGYLAIGVQVLFVLALIGHVAAFRAHGNRRLLLLAVAATLVLFAGFYVIPSSFLLQVALCGLIVASVWHVVAMKRCRTCAPVPGADDGGRSA
jgi:mercuric ion transport protein